MWTARATGHRGGIRSSCTGWRDPGPADSTRLDPRPRKVVLPDGRRPRPPLSGPEDPFRNRVRSLRSARFGGERKASVDAPSNEQSRAVRSSARLRIGGTRPQVRQLAPTPGSELTLRSDARLGRPTIACTPGAMSPELAARRHSAALVHRGPLNPGDVVAVAAPRWGSASATCIDWHPRGDVPRGTSLPDLVRCDPGMGRLTSVPSREACGPRERIAPMDPRSSSRPQRVLDETWARPREAEADSCPRAERVRGFLAASRSDPRVPASAIGRRIRPHRWNAAQAEFSGPAGVTQPRSSEARSLKDGRAGLLMPRTSAARGPADETGHPRVLRRTRVPGGRGMAVPPRNPAWSQELRSSPPTSGTTGS
jgi:hypothetical protein